jgi:hypothetical protein
MKQGKPLFLLTNNNGVAGQRSKRHLTVASYRRMDLITGYDVDTYFGITMDNNWPTG